MLVYAQGAVPDVLIKAGRIVGAIEGRTFWTRLPDIQKTLDLFKTSHPTINVRGEIIPFHCLKAGQSG